MTIEGDYTLFAHLETVYLGVLARRTLIATNVARVLEAARTASRSSSCRPATTTTACRPATATRPTSRRTDRRRIGVTSDAQASWWGGRGVGTVPHALIAAYGGDTVLAATKFAEWAPDDIEHHRARRLRERLRADRARGGTRARPAAVGRPARHVRPARRPLALGRDGRLRPARRQRAARPEGARRARRATGSSACRIVVSGGFTVEKIRAFEARGVPVDAYGVGSSLIRGENDFTADIVLADGRDVAKVGRRFRPNPRLELVT